jgi:hypothetical protein
MILVNNPSFHDGAVTCMFRLVYGFGYVDVNVEYG